MGTKYNLDRYNLDRYNYQFVLDEKGYLDDIIFLGKTPVIVEGRDLEHPENNLCTMVMNSSYCKNMDI